MRITNRSLFTIPLLVLSLLTNSFLLMSCGGSNLIAGFRVAFAASKPFVQSLVSSGALTQARADAATKDIDDGIAAAARAETCDKAITVTGSAKRVAEGKCYFALAQDLRGILARHNIGNNPRLDQIAAIASGAIEAFEQFFTTVTTGPAVTGPDGGITHTGADGISGENAEKQLKNTVEDLNRQLKALTHSSQ